MRTSLLRREQVLPVDIDTCFAFFSDARNLESITPPLLRFRLLTPEPVMIREGTLLDYELRIHGLPVRWQSLITDWQPPYRFVDFQTRGPYRYWHHTHTLERVAGGTLVRDEVRYAAPGGPLVERLLVRPDLERIFAFRQQWFREWAVRQTAAP